MTRSERLALARRIAKAKALREQADQAERQAWAAYLAALKRWRDLLTRAAQLEAGR